MRNKRNNGGILREARNEFEAELTSDTLLCFLLTDSGMTTYEISPTIYSPVRKDLEWSLTCNKGPHFATPLPGWDRNASSTDVMGYQDRTRYDGRPHYIIHNPGKGISRSGTFADVHDRRSIDSHQLSSMFKFMFQNSILRNQEYDYCIMFNGCSGGT